jgi:hypothetical protein
MRQKNLDGKAPGAAGRVGSWFGKETHGVSARGASRISVKGSSGMV